LNIIDDVLSRSKPNGVSEHPLTSKALDESTMELINSEIGEFEEERHRSLKTSLAASVNVH
jgi:hypothetical protein